jgi:FMN phosphatase YigB (HAD superfamily)
MASVDEVVFLLDVDNTLLDNDAVTADLRRYMREASGRGARAALLGHLRSVSGRYPFAERLYPHALEVIARLQERGPMVILSDGDVVFQPYKIERSGLWAAVDGRVLIYIHKERMLDDVERRIPARRYVMVDDKVRILGAMKAIWQQRLTTVFVKQVKRLVVREELLAVDVRQKAIIKTDVLALDSGRAVLLTQ